MRTFFHIALITVLSWLVLPAQCPAAESGDTIDVVISGVGKDADAALKNALRAAVEHAVGVMIDTETLVKNDEIVSDKILSLSSGFVQTYKQLGEPKAMDGGLVSVRISAEVKRNELDNGLRKAGVTQEKVNWESLYAERLTKMQSQDDGIDMLKWMIEEHLLNCIVHKAGETRWDQDKNKVVLEVLTTVDYDKYSAFTKRFTDVLKKMGVKYDGEHLFQLERKRGDYFDSVLEPSTNSMLKPTGVLKPTTEISGTGRFAYMWTSSGDLRTFCIASSRWRALTNEGQKKQERFDVYIPPRGIYDEVRNSLITSSNKNVIIELFDGEDRSVTKIRVFISCPFYVDQRTDHSPILIFPSLFRQGSGHGFWPGTPEYQEEIYFDIPMDEMKKIRTIQFRYE
jgi:hypothetical protein